MRAALRRAHALGVVTQPAALAPATSAELAGAQRSRHASRLQGARRHVPGRPGRAFANAGRAGRWRACLRRGTQGPLVRDWPRQALVVAARDPARQQAASSLQVAATSHPRRSRGRWACVVARGNPAARPTARRGHVLHCQTAAQAVPPDGGPVAQTQFGTSASPRGSHSAGRRWASPRRHMEAACAGRLSAPHAT